MAVGENQETLIDQGPAPGEVMQPKPLWQLQVNTPNSSTYRCRHLLYVHIKSFLTLLEPLCATSSPPSTGTRNHNRKQ